MINYKESLLIDNKILEMVQKYTPYPTLKLLNLHVILAEKKQTIAKTFLRRKEW